MSEPLTPARAKKLARVAFLRHKPGYLIVQTSEPEPCAGGFTVVVTGRRFYPPQDWGHLETVLTLQVGGTEPARA